MPISKFKGIALGKKKAKPEIKSKTKPTAKSKAVAPKPKVPKLERVAPEPKPLKQILDPKRFKPALLVKFIGRKQIPACWCMVYSGGLPEFEYACEAYKQKFGHYPLIMFMDPQGHWWMPRPEEKEGVLD